MQIKLFLLCILTGCMVALRAQETKQGQPAKKSCSCSFVPILQVGALMGEKGAYWQVQTIQGIRYKTWYAGVGAGVDWYGILGLPVFLDLRKDIFKTPNSPFFYADGGIHLAHLNNEKDRWSSDSYSNGFYSDVGFEFKVGISQRNKLLVSGGYSYKEVIRHQTWNWCDFLPCSHSTFTYTSHLHRVTLKMGWQF
jgi:hypothetical protein